MVSVTPGQHSLDAYSDESFRNAYDNDWIEMFTYQAKRNSLILLLNQNK